MYIRKWQEKHSMAIQDLQLKESALQRVEVELERTRNELDRSKLLIDKADGNKLIHEAQLDKLQKEIRGVKTCRIILDDYEEYLKDLKGQV